MFKKILIANRGEIAVRIIRACRDLGLQTVALYTALDQSSMHVRLADECWPLTSALGYGDADEVLRLAKQCGADAIHPGYGFLAEQASFAEACIAAGIQLVSPPADVLAALRNKVYALQVAQEAGFKVPPHSAQLFSADAQDDMLAFADAVGYPIIIKSCCGGRGRGARLIYAEAELASKAAQAQREARQVYGDDRLYLEHAILPAHYVTVQILADTQGNVIHLGEREGSVLFNSQKVLEESPAPCLSQQQRVALWEQAIKLARLFNYQGAGGVEFLVDGAGNAYFTEIKARLHVEHSVSEMVSGVDIVREQVRIAAGEPLCKMQDEIELQGWAMQCRINAEDPWRHYLPSPGTLQNFRLPGGPYVRVDTYGNRGSHVPVDYDSLLANLTVWADTRPECLMRLHRALEDFKIKGVQTNLPLYLQIVKNPAFLAGQYDTNLMSSIHLTDQIESDQVRQDLAVAAAVAFALRNQNGAQVLPERVLSGWHRSSRRLPS
ncbi:MAG: biotin carboxylase N-terminal domain-containing protein [Caldilineaceae bacterium]